MPELNKWGNYIVRQKDPILGCIPTGIEWMIRFKGIPDVDFEIFQEKFNLQSRKVGDNNFESISQAIMIAYPQVKIEYQIFDNGNEKLDFIRKLIRHNNPCLISLTLKEDGGWHIMPVVLVDERIMRLIWDIHQNGGVNTFDITLEDLINRHNNWPSGKDICWLQNHSETDSQ